MFIAFSRQLMLVTAIAICAAQPASGRTFYVDPDRSDASDENTGTEENPWQTLTGACQRADSGDVVWVKAGIFYETLRPTRDGITFAAYGNDSVTIRAPVYAVSTDKLQICEEH